MSDELTGKELIFALAYVGEAKRNATAAYKIAGYKGNDNTCAASAYKLLRKPKIQAFIAEFNKKYEITAENILRTLSEIAFNETEKASDRNKSLELLGKNLKLWSDSIAPTATVNVGITFEQWKEKADSRLKEVLENEQSESI